MVTNRHLFEGSSDNYTSNADTESISLRNNTESQNEESAPFLQNGKRNISNPKSKENIPMSRKNTTHSSYKNENEIEIE